VKGLAQEIWDEEISRGDSVLGVDEKMIYLFAGNLRRDR
jgi:hypothetical protein